MPYKRKAVGTRFLQVPRRAEKHNYTCKPQQVDNSGGLALDTKNTFHQLIPIISRPSHVCVTALARSQQPLKKISK